MREIVVYADNSTHYDGHFHGSDPALLVRYGIRPDRATDEKRAALPIIQTVGRTRLVIWSYQARSRKDWRKRS